MSGYITFHMNGRDLACQLDEVREVVRAVGFDPLPGTTGASQWHVGAA